MKGAGTCNQPGDYRWRSSSAVLILQHAVRTPRDTSDFDGSSLALTLIQRIVEALQRFEPTAAIHTRKTSRILPSPRKDLHPFRPLYQSGHRHPINIRQSHRGNIQSAPTISLFNDVAGL